MATERNIRKILLIFPPSTSLASWEPMVTTPMGIAYLASSVREAGYEVACLDAVAEAHYQETMVNDQISRFGLTFEEIMARVEKEKPDLVGLSCIFSNQWPSIREISRRVKSLDPDLPVICGGAHPTFLPEMCMNDAPVDFILKGESEVTFVELLNALKTGSSYKEIDGLAWRDGEAVRSNPKTGYIQDLDSIPFPAHDLLNPDKYEKAALPMGYEFIHPRHVPIVTSRGCPCKCTFCSSTHLWGNRYRVRSAENVLAEMDWLVERFKIRELKIQDDNLTIDRKRARTIFEEMARRPWRLHWNTPNGIATWTLDKEMLRLMKASGCFQITMAVESGNQEVLSKLIKKPLKLDKVREVNQAARDLGISRNAYFIIGFPGETMSQIKDSTSFARELKLDLWAIFIYNPLPGSELFQECLRRGFITEESFFEQGNLYFSSVIDSDEWTAEQLESIIRWEWIYSYLAIFRRPYLVGRRYFNFLRYRPSFLKFMLLRTIRAIKIRSKKEQNYNHLPTAGG